MPPAFVLSQDQTLKTIVSEHFRVQILVIESVFSSIHLRICVFRFLVFSHFVILKKYLTSQRITGISCLLCCLIFKVLALNFSLLFRNLSFGDLFILPHFQAFVKSFFNFFIFYFLNPCGFKNQKKSNPSASLVTFKTRTADVFSCFSLSRATALL